MPGIWGDPHVDPGAIEEAAPRFDNLTVSFSCTPTCGGHQAGVVVEFGASSARQQVAGPAAKRHRNEAISTAIRRAFLAFVEGL